MTERMHSTEQARAVEQSADTEAACQTVLDMSNHSVLPNLQHPVTIESIKLFHRDGMYVIRARSTDGAEGYAMTNKRAQYLHPILNQLVIPYFIGKDARQIESLIDGIYIHASNYKLAGLALWNCVAWVEFCLVDMLGKMAGKSIGELFGGRIRQQVPMYIASGRRDTSPEEEIHLLQNVIAETGARAVKFKIGGRMSQNADAMPGRTEGLIKHIRRELGDDIAIHADANGSYDAETAIEVGQRLEAINAVFFEEPCPFDHFEETKKVTEALHVPVAFGEQETSHRRFRWLLENKAVNIIQPDVEYNGGFIRTSRIANMAAAAGVEITPHVAGPCGFVYVLHLASFTANMGEYQEFKGNVEQIGAFLSSPIGFENGNGTLPVPNGDGLGWSFQDWIPHADEVRS